MVPLRLRRVRDWYSRALKLWPDDEGVDSDISEQDEATRLAAPTPSLVSV